jgi:hypothetical protein
VPATWISRSVGFHMPRASVAATPDALYYWLVTSMEFWCQHALMRLRTERGSKYPIATNMFWHVRLLGAFPLC